MITGTHLELAKQPKVPQWSLRGGDVFLLSPRGAMLQAPWTKVLWHKFFQQPRIPFVSFRFWGRFGFYCGAKGVGWDPAYSNWMPPFVQPEDFSILTARFFTDGD